jgi:hypothetical protein
MPPQQRPLMTIDEAATYLNVPARWVAEAVRQRKAAAPGSASTSGSASNIWTSWSPPANSR